MRMEAVEGRWEKQKAGKRRRQHWCLSVEGGRGRAGIHAVKVEIGALATKVVTRKVTTGLAVSPGPAGIWSQLRPGLQGISMKGWNRRTSYDRVKHGAWRKWARSKWLPKGTGALRSEEDQYMDIKRSKRMDLYVRDASVWIRRLGLTYIHYAYCV